MFQKNLELEGIDCRNTKEDKNPYDRIISYYYDSDNITSSYYFTKYHNILVLSTSDNKVDKNIIKNKLQKFLNIKLSNKILKMIHDKSLNNSHEIVNFKLLLSDFYRRINNNTIIFCENEFLVYLKKRENEIVNEFEIKKKITDHAFALQTMKKYFTNEYNDMIFIKLTKSTKIFIDETITGTLSKELKELQRLNNIEYNIKQFSKYCRFFDIFPNEIIYYISLLMITTELKSPIFNRLLIWSFSSRNYLLASLNDKWSDIFKISKKNPKFYLILYKLSCKSIIKFKY